MNQLLLPGLLSLLLALLLTPVVRHLAVRLSLIDAPDNWRKLHAAPIARAGGVSIAVAYFAGAATLFPQFGLTAGVSPTVTLLQKLSLPLLIIFLTGLLDDILSLRPLHKLLGQVAAAGALVASGISITTLAGNELHPWLGGALTVLWLVSCTNAFNLIDGLDGLAGGIGLIASATMSTAGLLNGDMPMAAVMGPLTFALLGFLRYNFHPASVFLGDSGSLLIGFLLGCGALLWNESYGGGWSALAAPLIALAVPLLDLTLSVARRFVANTPILGADRGHVHHRLLSLGLSPLNATVTLYVFGAITAVLALVETSAHSRVGPLAGVLFCCVILGGVRKLGYVEFEVMQGAVTDGTFRRLMQQEVWLRNFDIALAKAETVEEHWAAMQALCRTIGFHATELKLRNTVLRDASAVSAAVPQWAVQVQLPGDGWLRVTRSAGSTQTMMLERSLDLFSRHVHGKLGDEPSTEAGEIPLPNFGGELIRPSAGENGGSARRTPATRARL